MTIEPIVKQVRVKAPPPVAFDLFTRRMGAWWPKGGTLSKTPHEDIVIEPREGGRWFERDAAGAETQWGQVIAWAPPARVLLSWHIDCGWGFNPDLLTEVELTFAPSGEGGTMVTLTHRRLDAFGAAAADHAERLRGGWATRVQDYADYVAHHAAAEIAHG